MHSERRVARLGRLLAGVWIAFGAVASCSAGTTATGDSTSSSNAKTLTAAQYGEKWPFTVSEGVVSCEAGSRVYFTAGGVRYGVNGAANGRKDARDVEAIWKANPDIPGSKVNIGPIIDEGLRLC